MTTKTIRTWRSLLDVRLPGSRNTPAPTAVRGQDAPTTYVPVADEVEVRTEAELMAEGYLRFAAEDRATAETMLPVGFEHLSADPQH
jgi:hypothetical protein